MSARRARIFIYSHDTYGLGHLRRSLLIAGRLAEWANPPATLIATGSARAHSFECPQGCDILKLPSVVKDHDGLYRPRSLDLPLSEVLRFRGELLVQAAQSFGPDLILIDHAPSGVEGELRPLFQAIDGFCRRPMVALGLRDIIDSADRVRAEWDRLGIWPLLEETYDRIFVYGDSSLLSTAQEIDLPDRLKDKIRFTGYLARPLRRPIESQDFGDIPRVLVTTGGGGDGQALLRAYASFLEDLESPAPFLSTVVTGPFLSRRRLAEITSRLRQTGQPVEIVTFTDRIEELLSDASAIVSMAGYNTAVEVLSAGIPALLIPRETPRLEQTLRAERLADRTGIEWCPVQSCTPDRIGRFLDRALSRRGARSASPLDLGGLDRLAVEVDALLRGRETSPEAVPAKATLTA